MDYIKKYIEEADLVYSDRIKGDLMRYHKLLLEWNKRTNLFSMTDKTKLISRHFVESLIVLLVCDIKKKSKIMDVGSGAGFPGMVVGIVRNDLEFLLVESKRLKSLFLKRVVSDLGLKNVNVECERVENKLKFNNLYNSYDYVFTRAVGQLDIVYSWVEPLLKKNGFFIAWKGGNIEKEVEKMKLKYNNVSIDIIPIDDKMIDSTKMKYLVKVSRG